ncbi:hypothetical protein [Photobacterium leiognathi]|uniref:hypothetical protein n=1 Tax=Photobacterium leiognathi TaxID=553611 RepID=UPI002980F7CD|nr:hypothetical protein [Photobacterium leiognathi]
MSKFIVSFLAASDTIETVLIDADDQHHAEQIFSMYTSRVGGVFSAVTIKPLETMKVVASHGMLIEKPEFFILDIKTAAVDLLDMLGARQSGYLLANKDDKPIKSENFDSRVCWEQETQIMLSDLDSKLAAAVVSEVVEREMCLRGEYEC